MGGTHREDCEEHLEHLGMSGRQAALCWPCDALQQELPVSCTASGSPPEALRNAALCNSLSDLCGHFLYPPIH